MPEIGYWLSSEEHTPLELVRNARAAEEAGFRHAMISDHYHPWVDEQGHSAFVWGTIGGIAAATERLSLGTGVTCPMIRIHPAVIAQAAATAGAMMPGRFVLGLGTGENLNEHILGDRWPSGWERLEMLREAIEVIRLLWQGGYQSHRGTHYRVDEARIYTLPEQLPPIAVAAAKPGAAQLAGENDGLIAVSPDRELVDEFESAGGEGKPRHGQLSICWAESEAEARKTAFRVWPNAGVEGELSQELPLPRHFEQATEMVEEEDVAGSMPCGPDPEPVIQSIQEYLDAGFDHVYLHQIGPDQDGFFEFAKREILPRFA